MEVRFKTLAPRYNSLTFYSAEVTAIVLLMRATIGQSKAAPGPMTEWDAARIAAYSCFSVVASIQLLVSRELRKGLLAIMTFPIFGPFFAYVYAVEVFKMMGKQGQRLLECGGAVCQRVEGNFANKKQQIVQKSRPSKAASTSTAVPTPDARNILRRYEKPESVPELTADSSLMEFWHAGGLYKN